MNRYKNVEINSLSTKEYFRNRLRGWFNLEFTFKTGFASIASSVDKKVKNKFSTEPGKT